MELCYSPTEEDWRNVIGVSPKSGWNTFQFVLSFAPMGLLGGLSLVGGYSVEGWICILVSVAIAIAGYEVPRRQLLRQYRAVTSLRGERVVNINEGGINVTLPVGNVQYQWQAYMRYRETESLFVLFVSPYQVGSWIPKRVMSEGQIKELRQILKMRFPTV